MHEALYRHEVWGMPYAQGLALRDGMLLVMLGLFVWFEVAKRIKQRKDEDRAKRLRRRR